MFVISLDQEKRCDLVSLLTLNSDHLNSIIFLFSNGKSVRKILDLNPLHDKSMFSPDLRIKGIQYF